MWSAVMGHLLTSVCVCRMEDELAGEVPVAFVVKTNGSYVAEDDIKAFVAKQVREACQKLDRKR